MFRQLAAFKKALGDEAKRIPEQGLEETRKIAADLFSEIVSKTPVDTGFMSSKWDHQINRKPSGSSIENPRGGSYTAASTPSFQGFRMGDVLYIFNSVAYAVRIENGWSRQAPRNFVSNAVKRADRKLQSLYRNIR